MFGSRVSGESFLRENLTSIAQKTFSDARSKGSTIEEAKEAVSHASKAYIASLSDQDRKVLKGKSSDEFRRLDKSIKRLEGCIGYYDSGKGSKRKRKRKKLFHALKHIRLEHLKPNRKKN